MQKLILASASPRRAAILNQIKVPFTVVESGISEESFTSSDPIEHVLELSRRKAEMVADQIKEGLVLGADTIVVLENRILGKPTDKESAIEMLYQLSGKIHKVYSGVALVDAALKKSVCDFEVTLVKMRKLSRQTIDDYVATGEPMDKAGAYGIQGRGALLIEEIHGCFYNVMGLPLAKLTDMIKKMGWDGWPFR